MPYYAGKEEEVNPSIAKVWKSSMKIFEIEAKSPSVTSLTPKKSEN